MLKYMKKSQFLLSEETIALLFTLPEASDVVDIYNYARTKKPKQEKLC